MLKYKRSTDNLWYHVPIKPFQVTAFTNGSGLWSNSEKKIQHNRAELIFFSESVDNKSSFVVNHAELKIYFSKKYWDVNQYGLIYTDRNWIRDLRKYFQSMGYSKAAVKTIDYTEQGMQGSNYVSLDVGRSFLKQFVEKNK